MSKCDIRIEFDRADRVYRTGEPVRGLVRVQVNKALKCRGLQLNGFWKTHGRGNTTRQNYFNRELFKGEWKPGDSFEYPFEFQPPLTPLSYHGKYLNIDHFVSVRADIPWTIDPKHEEEFLWRIGSKSAEQGPAQPVIEPGSGCAMQIGLVASIMLAVAAITLAFSVKWLFLLALLPIFLIGFLCVRRPLAENKLGEVKWGTLGSGYTGEEMPSLVQIGPLGRVKITSVSSEVRGFESVVSGSGTSETTYTHEVYKKRTTVLDSPRHGNGETIELNPVIVFPDTDAVSVDLPDNKIKWTVTLAVRLAMWPDWVETREITLLPRMIQGGKSQSDSGFKAQAPDVLVELADNLVACGTSTRSIDQLIEQRSNEIFTVNLVVESASPSDSGFRDPDYAKGRTVSGTLGDTNYRISIQLPARFNEEADKLERGQSWSGNGALIRWEPFEEHLVLLGM